MWHAVTSVGGDYDPILYESPEESRVLVLNAGPGDVTARGWQETRPSEGRPQIEMELRPGDQRVLGGCLIRIHLVRGYCAAIGWRVLSREALP